ncbi:MAG: glycosyltransferase family 2 protein, partial [Pirellulales bacterium]
MTSLDEAPTVSLVIPARNAERTIDACLDAATRIVGRDHLVEVLLVDDGSTDRTRDVASRYPIRVLDGDGRGAAAARNVGWRAARSPWIWFIDADCVPRPDALALLRPHLAGIPDVAAAGGSYDNLCGQSWVASLVHEEIVERHRRMPTEVTVLASYHVLYRRDVLDEVGGFDATCRWAHDAELAYRVGKAGYRLHFHRDSRVGHV